MKCLTFKWLSLYPFIVQKPLTTSNTYGIMSDDSSFGWYDWLYLFICCLHHCSSCAQSLSIFHLCCPNHADAEECREFSTTMRKLQCSYCFCLCPVIYRSCWLLEKTLILEFCFYKISGNHATCFLIVNNPTACIHSPAESGLAKHFLKLVWICC